MRLTGRCASLTFALQRRGLGTAHLAQTACPPPSPIAASHSATDSEMLRPSKNAHCSGEIRAEQAWLSTLFKPTLLDPCICVAHCERPSAADFARERRYDATGVVLRDKSRVAGPETGRVAFARALANRTENLEDRVKEPIGASPHVTAGVREAAAIFLDFANAVPTLSRSWLRPVLEHARIPV